jgi:predicted O-methyltransferase YrrM
MDTSQVQPGQPLWDAVDGYLSDVLVGHDEALEAALAESQRAGLPDIHVAPNQGKMLLLYARMLGARRILEIGTLGGYSTIWLARGMGEGGRLVTLEAEPKHAEVARANLARAGVGDRVEVVVGRALETLPAIAERAGGPWDLFFIDADKAGIPEYFRWSLRLARRGSLIVVDNVVRKGAVIEAGSGDESVRGVRRFHEMVAAEPRVTGTAIQTVGVKGHDGFALVLVTAEP